jgi:hypothetical protein
VRRPVVGSTDRLQMVARGSPTRSCFRCFPKEAPVVGSGLVETRRALRYAFPGAPEGVPLIGSRVAVPSAYRNLRRRLPVDPKIHRSLVPLALPHGGISRTRHPWTADGAVPATIAPKGFRCKAGLASAPRTSRSENRSAVGTQQERLPSGFGSNGTRQHEAALNDVPQLGVGRCTGRSHPEGWGLTVSCAVPRRVRSSRSTRGPKTARTALAFRTTGGLP